MFAFLFDPIPFWVAIVGCFVAGCTGTMMMALFRRSARSQEADDAYMVDFDFRDFR